MNDCSTPPPGYRLPAGLRLGAVTLAVSDIARSLEFYEGLLGMHVQSRTDDTVHLGAADSDAPLLVLHGGAQPRASRAARLGLYHFAVLLPDRPALARLFRRLLDAGARPGAADHMVSEALYLSDPDDLGIELYRDRPRSEWTMRDGRLAMGSDPLDARGLLDAAGDVAWAGMPAGTIIGHLHLHVGAIADARSFYHDALGFDVVVDGYPGALFMSAGGYHHHLGVNTWAGRNAVPASDHEPRLLDWEIILPERSDVDAAAASLDAAGHRVRDGAERSAVDPWGTRLTLKSASR